MFKITLMLFDAMQYIPGDTAPPTMRAYSPCRTVDGHITCVARGNRSALTCSRISCGTCKLRLILREVSFHTLLSVGTLASVIVPHPNTMRHPAAPEDTDTDTDLEVHVVEWPTHPSIRLCVDPVLQSGMNPRVHMTPCERGRAFASVSVAKDVCIVA